MVGFNPLWKNMSSSVGIMKFPIWWNKHVPNHQQDVVFCKYVCHALYTILKHYTHHRRKFRSQTSDKMDRWKAEMGRVLLAWILITLYTIQDPNYSIYHEKSGAKLPLKRGHRLWAAFVEALDFWVLNGAQCLVVECGGSQRLNIGTLTMGNSWEIRNSKHV